MLTSVIIMGHPVHKSIVMNIFRIFSNVIHIAIIQPYEIINPFSESFSFEEELSLEWPKILQCHFCFYYEISYTLHIFNRTVVEA